MNSISATGRSGLGWADTIKARAQVKEKMFDKVDADGSGSIDKTELQGAMDKFAAKTGRTAGSADAVFAKVDADGDGALSKREFNQALKSMAPQAANAVKQYTAVDISTTPAVAADA